MTGPSSDRPDVIARPPRLALAALVVGLALDYAWPAPVLPGTAMQYAAGSVLIVAGLALVLAAMGRFRKAGTNVPTPLPATALVTDGLYRFSRNPIYVGMSLVFAGVAVAADNAWLMGLWAVLLIVIRYGVIAREEVYLERKFGDDYRRYTASVRRWL